jgi:cystathionine beta-lyase/cystathionine gamma-synthase
MRQHCENARAIAAFLDGHARSSVLYPGLPSHPGHEVALRQMRDFDWSRSSPRREERPWRSSRGRSCSCSPSRSAASRSLIEHPARMTHASTADAVRRAAQSRAPVGQVAAVPHLLVGKLGQLVERARSRKEP